MVVLGGIQCFAFNKCFAFDLMVSIPGMIFSWLDFNTSSKSLKMLHLFHEGTTENGRSDNGFAFCANCPFIWFNWHNRLKTHYHLNKFICTSAKYLVEYVEYSTWPVKYPSQVLHALERIFNKSCGIFLHNLTATSKKLHCEEV